MSKPWIRQQMLDLDDSRATGSVMRATEPLAGIDIGRPIRWTTGCSGQDRRVGWTTAR